MRLDRQLLAYGVAIGSTVVALFISLCLESLISRTIGAFFYIAIILTTWYGGFRPGMVTVIFSTIVIDYFFIPPRYHLWINQPEDVLRLGLFLVVAVSINLITGNLINSQQKIQQLNQKLAQENAQQLRMALSASQMGMWDWDMLTGKIKWSPEHEQLFGLAVGSFDGKYETFVACLYPDDRHTLNQLIQKALQTRSTYQHEYRIVWGDGSIHWVEERGQAFYNEAGQPVRMMGTIMAIDERKQVEAKLQEQFEQQRLVMQMTQRIRRSPNLQEILQTTVDEVRQFLQCDRVLIFQFSPGWGGTTIVESVADEWISILSLQIYDPCIGEENVEPFKKGLVTVKSDIYNSGISPCHIEFLESLQVRANLVVPVLLEDELWGLLVAHHCAAPRDWQSSEVTLLQQLGVQVSVAIQQAALFEQLQTELTEHRQSQIALQERESTLNLFAQYAPAAIAMFDRDMRYVMVSQRWIDDYNLDSIASLIGRSHYEIFPEISEEWRQIHQRCLAGAIEKSDEDLFVRADGSQQWIGWEVRPWHTADGEIGGIIIFGDDVTLRKQAQISLQQLNFELEQRVAERTAQLQKYERIVSSTKDGITLMNRNYIYQIVNQAYLDWCNKSNTEVVGHSVRDILGENLFANFIQPRLDRCLAGETIQYERWFDYPNLVPQFMSVTYTPYREVDENISGVIVSLRDLTPLKQAEQMLELQAVITRNMAEGICLIRADNGIIVYANPKFEQMFGYDSGELNGQHVSIVNYASESVTAKDVSQAIFTAVLENSESTYQVHNVKKDGTPFWCSATTSVFGMAEYGDVLVAVQQDITERKQTEDALRESEEKFRQFAENIQAVFWMKDIKTQQILYVNPAYETIWQRSCASLYQNSLEWLEAIHPEDRQQLEIALLEQLKTGIYEQKYRIIRPDGAIRWIRDRAFPIRNLLGELVRVAGLAEDITELERVDLIKSEFISIVSHELRTPLTAIRAAMGLLQSGIYDKKPEKFKRMIEIASIDSDRLVRLVNDILDLERLDSGRAVLEKNTCQAADLIEQAVRGVQAIAKPQNISFNIYPTHAQVWVAADAIIQTLTNLLGNAIKFSPADATITINVQQQTDNVLFQITDQGRGIPSDKLEAIFGRFQQVDASDSRSKGGTGLGLAICRSIIDQHGGQIWAESTVGVGSTFSFTVPLPPEEIT